MLIVDDVCGLLIDSDCSGINCRDTGVNLVVVLTVVVLVIRVLIVSGVGCRGVDCCWC